MQTLKQLGEEYLQSAEYVTRMIASCNERLRKARMDGDSEEVYRLRMALADHYAQRAHLLEISRKLRNYYNRTCIH